MEKSEVDRKSRRKTPTKNYFWLKSVCVAILTVFLFFAVFVIIEKWLNVNITPDTTVLAFAGIIATFIVVNNYAYIAQMRKEVDERLAEIEQKDKSIVNAYLPIAEKAIEQSETAEIIQETT